MGKKSCPQCRENCITFKLYFSATENGKKRNAIQADLDRAELEAKRMKSEMDKKDEINKSMHKWMELMVKNDPNNKEGKTLLHMAAVNGNVDIYRTVMEKVPDKNPKDLKGGTPLHCAAYLGHLDICELILKNTKISHPKKFAVFKVCC